MKTRLNTYSINSQKGMSLYEVVVSLGIATLVGFGAAYVVAQSQVLQTKSVAITNIDTEHYIALQKARSMSFMSRQLGLIDPKGNPETTARARQLAACLTGTADNTIDCRQFHSSGTIQSAGGSSGDNTR